MVELRGVKQDWFHVGRPHGIAPRTQRLRKNLVTKSFTEDRFKNPSVRVDPEKLRYYTESWRQNENLPTILRRALAFENVLNKVTIFIKEGEFLVGYPGRTPASIYFSPERPRKIAEELDELGHVDEKDKKELYELVEYWSGKSGKDQMRRYFTEKEWEIFNTKSLIWTLGPDYTQRAAPDWDYLFKYGLNGIIANIEQEIEKTKKEAKKVENLQNTFDLTKKIDFFNSMIICCKAAIKFSERFAELAKSLAEKEKDLTRKKELQKISTICRNVPANPPNTFHEAVQAYWFIWMLTHCYDHECHGTSDRIDQLLWPYYEMDVVSEKRITRDEAQELVECLWLKINEVGRLLPYSTRLSHQGTNNNNAITIAGQKPNGEDACNELTEVILDAVNSIRLYQPSVNFRYHAGASRSALLKAFEVVRTGLGYPSFKHDRVNIAHLMDMGYTLEEARDWALIGCMSPGVVGRWGRVRRNAWHLNIAKCLELALSNGVCMLTGKKMGPETGDVSEFHTYKELVGAFKNQIKSALELGMRLHNVSLALQSELYPRPFASALFEDSIKYKKDLVGVSRKSVPWINMVAGMVDVADSLAAIKKLIFAEKRISLPELVDILRKDWEGYEEIRQVFIHEAPKFGNDDDYVDLIAQEDVFNLIVEEMKYLKDIWGTTPKPLAQAVTGSWAMGKVTAALPHGKHARETLADGGISPYYGYDKKGPTAVLMSSSKMDHASYKGILLNQRFNPQLLHGEKGAELFLNYLKTWFDLNIDHIQFNIVDSETLKAAQNEPEKYADLMVRVAGYSAFFVELDREVQDSIIQRTSQEFI